MKFRQLIDQCLLQEDLNFLLTNRIPRRAATLFMGRFSKITNPLVRTLSISLWRFFSRVDLSDAATPHYRSLHDAFIRTLKPGARPINTDPTLLTSPCDGIIGAHGNIRDTEVFQAKGFPYSINDLIPDPELVDTFRNGTYVTIRITAGMYHRFHAPVDCHISRVTYISGDTWNVNPIALKRVKSLFCKNERAVIEAAYQDSGGRPIPFLMIPVAAILVASIRLHFIDVLLNLRYQGANTLPCDAIYRKGDELGWFEHGSTIILLFPAQYQFMSHIREGQPIRMGETLMDLRCD
jgi:phosphatidylserine decarboxylase